MNNIRSMDLNLLVVFDALFDERSVTRAATRLALTQPTVSGSLKRLRETFADQLFVRTSHGVLTTPRAEALAGPIKEFLAGARALVGPERFEPAKAEGTVKLCGSDYMQRTVLLPLIRAIRMQAPKLWASISPRPSNVVLSEWMVRGEIDLCVSAREVVPPEIISRGLYHDQYVCIARKKHPLKVRRISIEQLCAFEHLLVDPSGRDPSGPVDKALAKLGRKRNVAIAVPTFDRLLELLKTDDFLAFVPGRLLRRRESEFKVFETNLAVPTIEVVASWHPRLSGDARHRWLRDVLIKVASRQ